MNINCEHINSINKVIVTKENHIDTESICESCYQSIKPDLLRRNREKIRLDENLECVFHGGTPARLSSDLQMGICDACFYRCQDEELRLQELHKMNLIYVIPNVIYEGKLYIGPKESAIDYNKLLELNIRQVIVCCSHLPEYCMEHNDITYLRLPMADSLDQNLMNYVPHAIEFIENGIKNGIATLVHCNAGVSRSGATVIAYIMATEKIDYNAAYIYAKSCRHEIFPNDNFVDQLSKS
jgi:hypothetical protein